MRSGCTPKRSRDLVVAEAQVADVVPVLVARADQLREILVARHERDVLARRARMRVASVPTTSSASYWRLVKLVTPSASHR